MDPNAPITWSTKPQHYQFPSTSDALAGLKSAVDEEQQENEGKDSKSSKNGRIPSSNKDNNSDVNGKKAESKDMKFVGIFLAAVSGLFFTLCSVTVKLLHRIDPSEVLLFRAIVQLVLTIPILLIMKANPLGPKGVRLLVYIQGIVGCLTVTCIFIGFARLPVGDAATIIFSSPIFVMIFSHVILREHCGLYRVFVISLLLLGVVLIARPPFLVKLLLPHDNALLNKQEQLQNGYDVIGYCAALGGTLLTASNFVCMRRLREVHFSVLIFAFSVMSAIVSACVVAGTSEFRLPKTGEDWAYAVMVGVFGLLGQSLLAVAFAKRKSRSSGSIKLGFGKLTQC